MQLAEQKRALRQEILAARGQLSLAERAENDAAITRRLLQMPAYQQASTVLGYMNFGSEYAAEQWVNQALAQGKRLILPRVNRHANRLDLYVVADLESQLAAGLWGIREPVVACCERLIDINEVEFALLPGVAFDRNGARLGYGGGFYDKLLAPVASRMTRVAAAFELQLAQSVPEEPTDVRVGWLVTETETIDCVSSAERCL